jgi:hypothetical protein
MLAVAIVGFTTATVVTVVLAVQLIMDWRKP